MTRSTCGATCARSRTVHFMSILAVAVLAVAATRPANAASVIDYGSANGFTVLGFEKLTINNENSLAVTGTVGLGKDVSGDADVDGVFQKATVDGDLAVHSTAETSFSDKDFFVTGNRYIGSVDGLLEDAVNDATNASSFFASLTPDVTLGDLNDTSVSLNSSDNVGDPGGNDTGAINRIVYDIGSFDLKEDTISITGDANDQFILNVTGSFLQAKTTVLLNGIEWEQVLFNLLGTDDARINKEGTDFKGTVLAPDRHFIFQDGGALFEGRLLAENVTVKSGAQIVGPANMVPVPSTAATGLVLLGLIALFSRGRFSNYGLARR